MRAQFFALRIPTNQPKKILKIDCRKSVKEILIQIGSQNAQIVLLLLRSAILPSFQRTSLGCLLGLLGWRCRFATGTLAFLPPNGRLILDGHLAVDCVLCTTRFIINELRHSERTKRGGNSSQRLIFLKRTRILTPARNRARAPPRTHTVEGHLPPPPYTLSNFAPPTLQKIHQLESSGHTWPENTVGLPTARKLLHEVVLDPTVMSDHTASERSECSLRKSPVLNAKPSATTRNGPQGHRYVYVNSESRVRQDATSR